MKPLVIPDTIEEIVGVRFNLNSGYEMGRGLEHSKTEALFREVKDKLFPVMKRFGYEWKEPTSASGCPTMEKDGMEVYVHPMEITAHISKHEADALETELNLQKFNTFTYGGRFDMQTKTYHCSEEQALAVYEMNKEVMKDNVMELINRGFTGSHDIWNEIHKVNKFSNTADGSFYGYSSDDMCSKALDVCLKEMEQDRIIECNQYSYRKCRKRKEPYYTVMVKQEKRKNGSMQARYYATVKTKDCVPVVSLPFYPDGYDLKCSAFFHKKEDNLVEKNLKQFLKLKKKEIVEMGKLMGTATRLEKKQQAFQKDWKEYYLEHITGLTL